MSNCTRKAVTAQTVECSMEQHAGLVYAFVRRQGGGDIPYEEALQAGRIGLWRAIQGYDPAQGTTFSTYAWVAICRHVHRRAKELSRDTRVEVQDMPVAQGVPDPAEELERKLTISTLHDMINQLPHPLRRVIVGRYGLGEQSPLTLKGLGTELNLSYERVRQLEQEALAWLRHPVHSGRLRQLLGKNTPADYRRALAQNAAVRRRSGRKV